MIPTAAANIPGSLSIAYQACIPSTFRHVDELVSERREIEGLRQIPFYTADGVLYFMNGERPMVAITREPENLILRHPEDAIIQLYEKEIYCPSPEEAKQVINMRATAVFDLGELGLKTKRRDSIMSFLEISTTEYDQLTPEQRRLTERIYGKGTDFLWNMDMLKQEGIDTTRIYLSNPDYVQREARDGPIGQASLLHGHAHNSSSFCLAVRDIQNLSQIRAVRR